MASVPLPDPVVRRTGRPPVNVSALQRTLGQRVDGEVRFDAGSRGAYSTDASNYRQVPIGVVVPRTVEGGVEAVAACREHGAPVVSRGGGTSLAGQACNVAVVIDWSKYCHRVVSVDAEAKTCVVEPGIVLDELNGHLSSYGLMFGPRPATHDHCTLGGMIGNNSCGATAQAYGKTVNNTVRLEVLTYDGEPARDAGRRRLRPAGRDGRDRRRRGRRRRRPHRPPAKGLTDAERAHHGRLRTPRTTAPRATAACEEDPGQLRL